MNISASVAKARELMHRRGMSPNTARTYAYWIRRFLDHHATRSLDDIGEDEVLDYLNTLGAHHKLSASACNLARNAIAFLFDAVLERPIDLGRIGPVRRARALPVVLTRDEVEKILQHLQGSYRIIAELLYSSGLRLAECLELRVRDIDFKEGKALVRRTRKRNNRSIALSPTQAESLRRHVRNVRARHRLDIEEGYGAALLPETMRRSRGSIERAWEWQYLFPAAHRSLDPISGSIVRGHLDETVIQRAFKRALHLSGVRKAASLRTLRHSFAMHLLEDCRSIETVRRYMGHADIRTTRVYAHLLESSDAGAPRSRKR